MLRLLSPHLEVLVDPDLGAEIVSVRRPGGRNVLARYDWAAPLRLRDGRTYGSDELDWLSEYRGGWQVLFPNAGAPGVVDGIPVAFHGEASRARWAVERAVGPAATLSTPVRLPLVLRRRMWLDADAPVLRIEETVTADAPMEIPFLWGHHPAFVATEGASIDLPESVTATVDDGWVDPGGLGDLAPGATGTWPAVRGRSGEPVRLDTVPSGPLRRLVWLDGFPDPAWAAIRGIAPGLGVALSWDQETFPVAWQWWELGGAGHPWHGRARIVAIEPNTARGSGGLVPAIARGTVHRVGPGTPRSSWITLALFAADERPVTGVTRDGVVTFG